MEEEHVLQRTFVLTNNLQITIRERLSLGECTV